MNRWVHLPFGVKVHRDYIPENGGGKYILELAWLCMTLGVLAIEHSASYFVRIAQPVAYIFNPRG
jgi:hypothetical protein